MKSLREYLWFDTKTRREYLNITSQVQEVVRKSGVQEGLCLVNAMHITASVLHQRRRAGPAPGLRRLAGEAGAPRTDLALPAQPDRRGQRRRAPEAPDHGPRSGRRDHGRKAGLRSLGADLLRGIRRPPPKTGAGEDYRRVIHSLDLTEPRTERRAAKRFSAERVPERSKRDHPTSRNGFIGWSRLLRSGTRSAEKRFAALRSVRGSVRSTSEAATS